MDMETIKMRLILLAVVTWIFAGCVATPSGGSSRRGQQAPAEALNTDKNEVEKENKVILVDEKNDEEILDKIQKQEEASTDCYKAEPEICAIEKEVLALTNQLRAQQGRTPLVLSPELSWSAREWSVQMGKSGFISHIGFPNSRLRDYQAEFGKSARMSAENVAMNHTNETSAANSFFNMWKNSPGHRRNMLGNSRTIGIGLAKNSRGGWYATQIFGQ